jgi:uncharacterized protein
MLLIPSLARADSSPTDTLAVPPLTGPVVDLASMLSTADRSRLEELARLAREQENGNGVQLQFLLVPSLQGVPIEDFSIRVAEAWKIGSKGKDNGLLFVVSRDDRRTRIEIGGGLEGELTDLQSARILRNIVQPEFREGRYGDGLYDGARQALAQLGALPAATSIAHGRPSSPQSGFLGLLIFLIILAVLGALLRSRGRSGFFAPGGYYGGGFGGGGGGGFGGGGGWSGGGGGFSGGGSSGSW